MRISDWSSDVCSSDLNTLDTAVRATGIGSYAYLPKPFDLDELTARVRAALQRRTLPSARTDPAPAASHGQMGRGSCRGKSVYGRVDLGGGSLIQKQTRKQRLSNRRDIQTTKIL